MPKCRACKKPATRCRSIKLEGRVVPVCIPCWQSVLERKGQMTLAQWGAYLAAKLGLKPIGNSAMSRWLTPAEIRARQKARR